MSQYGQVKQILCFRALPKHCDFSIPARFHKDWAFRHTSEHTCAHQLSLNITQIPSDSPPDTPICSRHVTDTNRQQQTSPDILKHSKTSLGGGWLCLGVSGAVCWCLVLSVGVLCCLGLPGGCKGVFRVLWDAFVGVLGCLRCLGVLGMLSGSSVLAR